jgi:Fur family peroxide stress response transcriptional regulator
MDKDFMEPVPARNSQRRFQEMIEGIKTHGMRLTPQRAAVARMLAFTREHPSVEQIHAAVKADFPMTSLATVYKTVALLTTRPSGTEISAMMRPGPFLTRT